MVNNRRGPKTLKYTYAQIGELVGLKPRTVAVHAGNGTFDPDDLHSLVEYINVRTGWGGRPRGQTQYAAILDDQSFGRSEMTTSHGAHKENYDRVMDRELARKEIARPEVAAVIAELDTALKEEFPDLEMHLVPGEAAAHEAFKETLGKGDHVASFAALVATGTAHCGECNANVLADTLVVGCIGLDEKRLCPTCKDKADDYGS